MDRTAVFRLWLPVRSFGHGPPCAFESVGADPFGRCIIGIVNDNTSPKPMISFRMGIILLLILKNALSIHFPDFAPIKRFHENDEKEEIL